MDLGKPDLAVGLIRLRDASERPAEESGGIVAHVGVIDRGVASGSRVTYPQARARRRTSRGLGTGGRLWSGERAVGASRGSPRAFDACRRVRPRCAREFRERSAADGRA